MGVVLWLGWRGLHRADIVSRAPIGWGTRAHFQLAYYSMGQICAHCTYLLNLDQLAYYSIDQTCAHCTFFCSICSTRGSSHVLMHIAYYFQLTLHCIGYCTLLFSAQREIEAQGKPPIASCQTCKVGNIDTGR